VTPQPIFVIPAHVQIDGFELLGAVAIGVGCGLAAWVMTQAVYLCEDAFKKLTKHIHWMWWPMMGGLVIGLGGLVDPRALGVGYDTIHAELLGRLTVGALVLLFVVKLIIWSGGLGSGTSGGILAPILMMGAALGGIAGHVLPGASPGVWALVGLAGALAGVTRSPFTAIVFAFELTYDEHVLLALLVAATFAHLVSVLVLKRSILTEKVARRGFHVMREYSVDPLEATFVREVMDTEVFTVEPESRLIDVYGAMAEGSSERRQRLYPVMDTEVRFVGVLPWSAVLSAKDAPSRRAQDAMSSAPVTAYPDEILRSVADRMAAHGVSVIPVIDRNNTTHLVGLVSQFDLLKAREKLLVEERHTQRILTLRGVVGRRSSQESIAAFVPEMTGDDSMVHD
jgi:CBS domain-containing protein